MTVQIDPNDPSAEQLQALSEIDKEGPFHFVNLLAFKKEAEYPTDHALANSQLSGADAYDKYGAVAFAQVIKRGGRLITLNNVELEVIGSSGAWGRVATMEYQNINAFLEMLSDPDYTQAVVHRKAGLEKTAILVTRPKIHKPLGGKLKSWFVLNLAALFFRGQRKKNM